MTEVCTTTPGTTSPNEGIRATLSPTTCAPWCRDGAGHTDAWHQEDQWCGNEPEGVTLLAEPLITHTMGGETFASQPTLDAQMVREAYSTRTLVHLSHNGSTAIGMTAAEAVALGEILTRLGREAGA